MSTLLDQLTKLSTESESIADTLYENDTTRRAPPVSKKNKKKKENPNEPKVTPLSDFDELEEIDLDEEINSRSKKKRSSRERMSSQLAKLNSMLPDQFAEEFDAFLDDDFDDEDSALSKALVSQGRKYARETALSPETSDIAKSFSASEKKLKSLMDEIEADKEIVDNTLKSMRNSYTRNYKSMADLISAKNSWQSTQLSIIKELNAIKKTVFDLKLKDSAAKKAQQEDSSDTSSMFRNLFSLGKGDLVGSLGGYEAISGAYGAGSNNDDSDLSDEVIQEEFREIQNDDRPSSDGDQFLKYEGQGIHWLLLIDESDGGRHYEVVAEDEDGNIVPDYPLPTNVDELHFDINPNTMEATDELKRTYVVRYI